MFQRTKICTGLLIAFGASVAGNAIAQDADSSVQRVEITGSSIKRINIEGALPVQTLTSEDLKKTGFTSAADVIQNLPAMQGFTTSSQSVNGGGGGTTTASLHGIGSAYTLVLLNGRRLAPFTTGSDVNLNEIPLAAIDRVEVLTDGASALYGSDAIAGVVNFILKKDSTDGAISLSGYKPQKKNGGEYSAQISKGFGDLDKNKFNVLLAASFDDQKQLNASDRSFSKSGHITFTDAAGVQHSVALTSVNSVPGNASLSFYDNAADAAAGITTNETSATINPNLINTGSCGSALAVPQVKGTPGTDGYVQSCRFDYPSTVQDLPGYKRASFFGSGRVQPTENFSVFTEVVYSHFETDARYAAPAQPLGITDSQFTNDVAPALAKLGYTPAQIALYDTNNSISDNRLFDAGGRTDRYQYDTLHAVLGTDFTFGTWDSSVTYTHSQNKNYDKAEGGYLDLNQFNAIVDSGAFDPFTALPGTAVATLAPAVLHQTLDTSKSSIDVLHANTSSLLFKLPGGDLGFGTGVDIMKQKFTDNPSAILQGTNALQPTYTDAIVGGGGGALPFDSSRNSFGIYTELDAPITKQLDLNATARYDSYQAVKNSEGFDSLGNPVGDETQGRKNSSATYKLSAAFRPSKDFLLRGSVGTGFKAPSLSDVTKPLSAFGNTGEHACPPGLDPAKAVVCRSGLFEYNIQNGGNPATGDGALKPEKSTQWTLGGRFEPSPAFSLGVDLWTVRLRDQINTITEDTAFANGALYNSLFIVAPDPINGHPTLTFLEVPINTGNAFYQGIDIDGESHTATPIGRLTTRAHVTYMLRADYQEPGNPGYVNSMNKIGPDSTVMFQWQANLQLSLETGAFTNTLTGNFKPGYADDTTDYAAGRHVGNYNVFDFQTKYDFNKSLSLTGGIMNLFDKNPPITLNDQEATGNARGYDGRYTNPIGRDFYLNVTYKF